MSDELLAAVRRRVLASQRTCAACGKRCEDADHLYLHLVLRHDLQVALSWALRTIGMAG